MSLAMRNLEACAARFARVSVPMPAELAGLIAQLRFDDDQPRDPDGKWTGGDYDPANPRDDISRERKI